MLTLPLALVSIFVFEPSWRRAWNTASKSIKGFCVRSHCGQDQWYVGTVGTITIGRANVPMSRERLSPGMCIINQHATALSRVLLVTISQEKWLHQRQDEARAGHSYTGCDSPLPLPLSPAICTHLSTSVTLACHNKIPWTGGFKSRYLFFTVWKLGSQRSGSQSAGVLAGFSCKLSSCRVHTC